MAQSIRPYCRAEGQPPAYEQQTARLPPNLDGSPGEAGNQRNLPYSPHESAVNIAHIRRFDEHTQSCDRHPAIRSVSHSATWPRRGANGYVAFVGASGASEYFKTLIAGGVLPLRSKRDRVQFALLQPSKPDRPSPLQPASRVGAAIMRCVAYAARVMWRRTAESKRDPYDTSAGIELFSGTWPVWTC